MDWVLYCKHIILSLWFVRHYNKNIQYNTIHSLQNDSSLSLISPFQIDIPRRKYAMHRWERRDELISAFVTTSSPRLKARAWCGDLCWDDPISPSQLCHMNIVSRSAACNYSLSDAGRWSKMKVSFLVSSQLILKRLSTIIATIVI